ncbi:regulatory protein RecX [Arabiibacter massiliensis]|uniref:regulatory protein RecX n=1 Tax=Arabiibacter massiliensis TaxID=1870985 RepID=UPI0009BA8AAE|nr:RecX family transcriptional regulator [Arabiibacter massiliensis]
MPPSSEEVRAALRARIDAIEGGPAPHAAAPQKAREEAEAADGPAEAERAFRKIERLASAREQASAALRRRLARDGFSPEAVEESLARALSCGLVDDMRYADVLVRSRLAQGRGRQGIAAELADLGIDPDGVEALAESDEGAEREVERALDLLERRPPRAKNARDAAYRRLVQKGYGASAASTAARLWSEAREEER